jgi:radial spoke head protein 4A
MEEQLQALDHQIYGAYTLSKHLGEVLETMTHEQPADPLASFEEMSCLLWAQRHITAPSEAPDVPTDELDRCAAMLALLEKLNSSAYQKIDSMFFEFSDKWADVGIVLDPDFALLLRCSLVKLAEIEIISTIRLWGTFNTPLGVLYVAEADIPLEFREADAPDVGPYDVPVEVGIGVNRFVYYVTRSPFEEWQRLPDVRASEISGSRAVIWQLTGDLQAAVKSFTGFEATEDVYLRALIARISASTIVAPQGYISQWHPEEEDEQKEPVGEEEEAKEPPPKQLKLVLDPEFEAIEDVSNIEWVHVRPFILPQGRETYKKAPKPPKQPKAKKEKKAHETEGGEEDEEEQADEPDKPEDEAAEEEEEAPEEGLELFGAITEDEPIREEEPCWSNRVISSKVEGQSFAVAESVRWPGAFNISDGKKACSFYYGSGGKFVINGFQPPAPPPIAREYRRKMREKIDPTLDDEKEVEKAKHPPKEEEEEDQEE